MGRCASCNGNCCTGPVICQDCDCGAREKARTIIVSEKIDGRDMGVVRALTVKDDEKMIPDFFRPDPKILTKDGSMTHPLNGTIIDSEGVELEVLDWSTLEDLVD